MVIHFSQALNTSSCGRTGASLSITQDQGQVTCKSCLRTLEKKAAPRAEPEQKTVATPARQPAVTAQAAPATHVAQRVCESPSALSPSESWRHRLAEMPGRNRLPRGGAQQVFI